MTASATATRVHFPGISPRAWEHPADRAALVALRKIPGFDVVLRKVIGFVGERSLRLMALASSVRVGENQFPELWASYLEACEVLDIDDPPELYVAQTPFVNAGAVGVDRPFIQLHSGALGTYDKDELQVVLAHELAHCMSGHALYKTMLGVLLPLVMRMPWVSIALPVGGVVLAVTHGLREWDRKSELSADRAGFLVAQDEELALRVLMKLAGGDRTQSMSVEAFLSQARDYEEGGSGIDTLIKLMNLKDRRHPFPVLRVAELKRWIESDDCRAILEGTYARRTEDGDVDMLAEVRASARSYRERLGESQEPLVRMMRDLGTELGGRSSSLLSRFRRSREEEEEAQPREEDA